MERQTAPKNIKKKTREYYNCGIKKYLARDCRKPKTGPEPQKKQQTPRKSQKQILVVEAIPPQKKNRQLVVLEKQNIKIKIPHTLLF